MLTVFDIVPGEYQDKFREYGFFYGNYADSNSYLNIFRWMWNECHIHPDIKSFPGDTTNSTMVSFSKLYKLPEYTFVVFNYDDAIIETVNFLYKNIDNIITKK